MVKNLLDPPLSGYTQKTNNNLHRALYIPMYQAPCVLEDDIDAMKHYVFYGAQTYTLSFDGDNYFVLASSNEGVYTQVNFFATTLYRTFYISNLSSNFTIYGPTLLIGMDTDLQYTSVSVEILDATINLMTRYQYEV